LKERALPVERTSGLSKKEKIVRSVLNELNACFRSLPSSSLFSNLSVEKRVSENELLELPAEGPPDYFFVWFGCPYCGKVNVLTGDTFRSSCLIQCPACGSFIMNEAKLYGTKGSCIHCPKRINCLPYIKIKRDEICMTARLL